jgi:hypothetical protein
MSILCFMLLRTCHEVCESSIKKSINIIEGEERVHKHSTFLKGMTI